MINKNDFYCSHYHDAYTHPNCWRKYAQNGEPKTIYLDIESTGLKANFSNMLSYAIKPSDSEITYTSRLRKRDFIYQGDKRLVQEICDILHTYERVVTYYGSKFDIPYIRTKALEYGIDFPAKRELTHLDLYYTAKHQLNLSSNRLIAVCDLLNVNGKDSVQPRLWRKASFGDEEALKAIQKHNIMDVVTLEKVHKKLMPHIGYTRRTI